MSCKKLQARFPAQEEYLAAVREDPRAAVFLERMNRAMAPDFGPPPAEAAAILQDPELRDTFGAYFGESLTAARAAAAVVGAEELGAAVGGVQGGAAEAARRRGAGRSR